MFGDDNFVPLLLVNLLGAAGIVVWHIQGGNRPTSRLLVQIVFFTGMSLVLYLAGITPHRPDSLYTQGFGALLSKSARILWWTHLAWAIIGFIQIYFRLNRKPREARLILDMAIAVIYLGVAVIGFVFGMPVGTLVTTSGVIAVIFGLAMQNTLGDVFSGVALTLGRAYAIGDWIQLTDGTEGRIIETNWRSTNLLTVTHNVVVLPNSILAKQGVTNLSRPDETHQIAVRVRIAATQTPRLVEEVMRSVLQSSVLITKNPPPVVALKAIDAIAIEVELQFRVDNVALRTPARNEIVDLIHDQCKVRGLSLAMPAESLAFVPAPMRNQYAAVSNDAPMSIDLARRP